MNNSDRNHYSLNDVILSWCAFKINKKSPPQPKKKNPKKKKKTKKKTPQKKTTKSTYFG